MNQNKTHHLDVPTLLIASMAVFATIQAFAQDRPAVSAATNTVNTAPAAPAVLPGKGLAQHDFFYAGES
jgi:hypothetical protein